MEEMMKSNVGMNKEAIKKMLEDEEFIDLQVELLDKTIKKLEEKGYSTDQAIKLVGAT